MGRRDHWDEATLAIDDERRDAIDRIHARCKRDGIIRAGEVVGWIVRDLATEMRPLVEVELTGDPEAQVPVVIGPADTAIIVEALDYWQKVCSAAPQRDIARIRALLASPGGGS